MVVTRSQADASELKQQELENLERERQRRLALELPAPPVPRTMIGVGQGATNDAPRAGTSTLAPNPAGPIGSRSPVRSVRSQHSTASAATRTRLAELEAEEKLAILKKKELEIEADLIRKKLAVDLSAIQDDQESLHDETRNDHHQKVDTWLRNNTLTPRMEKPEEPMLRTKEERHLRFKIRGRSPTPVKSRSNIETLTEAMEKLARPRTRCPELQAFSGLPNEWLIFKATFQDSTKVYQLSSAENLQRLRSCLKGEARDLVAALLHTASDPEIIMKTLEQCFGRPEIIIDRAMEDLKKLPKPGTSAMELNNFAVKLQNVVCVFRSVGRHEYLYNPMLARAALEKLSPHIRSRWCVYAFEHEGTADPEIVVLSRFLMREADRALQFSYAPSTSQTAKTVPVNMEYKRKPVYAIEDTKEKLKQPRTCILKCTGEHKLPKCPKFRDMVLEQRWELVKKEGLCFKCISSRHRRENCKSKQCGVNGCRHPHHAMLHSERASSPAKLMESNESIEVVTSTTTTTEQQVMLKICPVTLIGPLGRRKVYALLDEGSTISIIEDELARDIGAEGPDRPLSISGVSLHDKDATSRHVKLQIQGADRNVHTIRARTMKNMALRTQTISKRLLQLNHLQDLNEESVCYNQGKPRITRPDGSISLSLVAAKAKVAPKRTQTIPRLELQAAIISVRLADTIKKEHNIEAKKTVYWTDSMTVIHWVRHDTRRYTPFVAHRLGEIAELTQKEDWRWIPTCENIADDATRLTNAPINAEDRWFRGPDFLLRPEDQWPVERTDNDNEEEVLLHVAEEDTTSDEWLPDPARFSKYETLVRTSARVLAFIDMCRRRTTRVENRHIEEAERAIILRAQKESFQDEMQRLGTSRPITRSSRLYRLDPVLEDGILRVKGRIGAATAPLETKRPIILDGRHRVTKLLVLREHCAAGHANRERVTNDLKQRYWIIQLRPTVRTVQKNCSLCQVRRSRLQVPVTGDLPRARLEPFRRPFTNCGADYFGPITVKIGRRREKRWGALFTCLTSRALHIELVPSLSTNSAIMAMRRMAARRGWPRIMYSDNATNFRGADKELKAAYAEWATALQDEGLLHRMEWRYIPPGAPNQGGAWERLVRSVKVALAATLKEKEPTEEVLATLLTEAEFSINARPLTHVSVDPRDPEALTPNHFLLGSSTGLPLTGPCSENDRRTWKASLALADHFWQRWVREYLPTLIPRGEPTTNKRQLQNGDIVIIVDHTLPRNVWPMGIVGHTYKGPDGGVRVADVRTKTGTFKRPVRKLVVLVKEEATRAAPGGEDVKDNE